MSNKEYPSRNRSQMRDRRVITVKPSSYQPSKAEMGVDVSINATPEQLAQAIKMTRAAQE